MRGGVKLTRITHPRYRWKVRFPRDGKRVDSYFRTKAEAEAFRDQVSVELKEHGSSLLTDSEASAVRDCRERLAAHGLTVREALQRVLDAEDALARHSDVLAPEAVEELIEAKRRAGLSRAYLSDLKVRLGAFTKAFSDRSLASISTGELEEYLRGRMLAPVTHGNERRLIIVLWNFGEERHWCDSRIAKKIEKIKTVDAPVGIITPAETARLLHAADDEILPAIAIGAFAGLRRAEIERLDWSEVDIPGGYIEVKAAKAKSAKRRLVAISPNLKAWLQPLAQHAGPVVASPRAYRAGLDEARKRAGFTDWPANALRHGFASYHLAHHQDAAKLALEMGHTNSALIFAHYREIVRPKAAEAYWAIAPEDSTGKVVAL